MTGLFKFVMEGGVWMWPIMAAQIVSFALIAERLAALYFRRGVRAASRVRIYEEDIKRGQMDRVLSRAERSNDPVAQLVRTGAQAVLHSSGKEEIQLKMEELVMEESSRIEKHIGMLSMLANVATLLGLLGTIVGMIRSFSSIASAAGAEKARLMAEGISEAMNATAYGLIVAVPALVMFAVLQNRANHLIEDLNKAALRLYIWFGFNVDTPTKSSRRSS
ncbi:MAG: MotA/TolQ/ExbB proton channel family protein [Bdellovibrio sp.]|nr:MAG: MotA/TolQ/ExbB proton channel family protein [Bdellovibrio sp.]